MTVSFRRLCVRQAICHRHCAVQATTDEFEVWATEESHCSCKFRSTLCDQNGRRTQMKNREGHMSQHVHRRWWARVGFCALTLSTVGSPGSAAGQAVLTAGLAPDATGQGAFTVATSQYRLPASIDPTIMTDRATEIWARGWRPQTELDRFPLVVFLHGTHCT